MKQHWINRMLSALLIMALLVGTPVGYVRSAHAEFIVADMDGGAAIDIVSKIAGLIVDVTPEAAASAIVEWGVEEILGWLFGGETTSEEEKLLKELMDQIKDLSDAIHKVQEELNLQSLITPLNDMDKFISNKLPGYLYQGLIDIDNDKTLSEDEKRANRLSLLTDSIGAVNPANIDTNFDNFARSFANMMLDKHRVVLDGESKQLMIYQVYYEYLRRTYKWEHQAWDNWVAFQCRAVAMAVQVLTIERFSLQARLELIRENNKDPHKPRIAPEGVEEAIKDIQKLLNKLRETYGKNNDWIPKALAGEDERYYWVPGHEVLLYATANTQSIPKEDRQDRGWYSGKGEPECKYIKGIAWHDGFIPSAYPVWSFWKPFFRPSPTRLTTYDELINIYNDYGKKKTFYDIFINKDEGNFIVDGDPNQNWCMVFDPAGHELQCHAHSHVPYSYFTVEAFFLPATTKGSNPKEEKLKIAWYDGESNHTLKDTCFIGLRVKKSFSTEENDDLHLSAHMDEIPCGWVSIDGDLHIALDEALGAAQVVTVDDAALSGDAYRLDSNGVTVTRTAMLALVEGLHTFIVQAEKGTMTVSINVGPALSMSLPESLQTIGDGAFMSIAARGVQIHDGCTSISANAFAGSGLAWIVIPDSVTEIGIGAFAGCEDLMILCGEESAAEAYANNNNIHHRIYKK